MNNKEIIDPKIMQNEFDENDGIPVNYRFIAANWKYRFDLADKWQGRKDLPYITSPETWFAQCPPKKKEFQWKDGRSAKEFARYMTKKYAGSTEITFPYEIRCVLGRHTNEQEFDLYPEKVTDFPLCPFGKGEGRNHDALVFGSNIAMGIEAKADEPFDRQYKDIEIYDTPNHRLRYVNSYHAIFGEDAEIDGEIYYQLVSASLGTLIEAKRAGCDKAVLLIVTLLKDGCYSEENVIRNKNAVALFKSKLKVGECGKLHTQYSDLYDIDFYIEEVMVRV